MKWLNVLRIVNGKNQRNVESADGTYPIYGSGGVMGYATDYLCPAESVVIGRKGTINKPIFVETEFWNVDTAFGLVADTTVLLPKYLYYFCLSYNFESLNTTVTIPSLTKANLQNIEMKVPSRNIQNKVILSLDAVSEVLRLRKAQLAELDNLVKSQFVEMFGDPETNPYGWEKVTVNDVCSSIVRGPFGSALKKEFFVDPGESTYKVYEQKHAIQKSASIGTYYVTSEKYAELKRFECHSGDVLMSCSGTMGEFFELPSDCERGIINQALCKFTLNGRFLPIAFLTYMRQTIRNLETKGSGIQNIAAVSYVKAMPINLPPMETQVHFAAFVAQTDKCKAIIQQSLDETQRLFDSLMAEYFED